MLPRLDGSAERAVVQAADQMQQDTKKPIYVGTVEMSNYEK
jgi:hypothetical protein